MHKRTWRLVAAAAAFAALTTAAVSCGSDGTTSSSSTTKAESGGGEPKTLNVPADYKTIQEAVDAAKAGDLVLVDEGTYNEAVDVSTEDITIRGVDRNKVILDGEFKLENGIRVLDTDGVTELKPALAGLGGVTVREGAAGLGGDGLRILDGAHGARLGSGGRLRPAHGGAGLA